jgi:putative zinc finger protein
MKEKSNNEIDLLLRRMARHDGSSVSNGEAHLGQHLDVDELSSYAQNALPPAARARYTEHLAECSTCRKLVTELSLSLGATAAAAPVETVSAPGGLKKFLASLFSPMVLRYAVPALGLIVVAAIGFVTLRRQNDQGSVAQINVESKTYVPGTAAPDAAESQPSGFVDPKQEAARAKPEVHPTETAPKAPAGEGAGAGPVAAAPPIRDSKLAEPTPVVADEPPAPRPAKAAETQEEQSKKNEATAKKQADTVAVEAKEAKVATSSNEPVRRFEARRAAQPLAKGEADNKAKDAPSTGVVSAGNARVFSQNRGDADKTDADTRSVAGRRFRKERGIWTDTAYDSSTATVNVVRGSEQFRALVADEPEIKKIAEQLDGEVIVVWKGRAYRIR